MKDSGSYGYNDPRLVTNLDRGWDAKRVISLIIALAFLLSVWYLLDQKLLFGEDWLSPTYDRSEWRTNEGNLQTYGMWDLETHIWKTEFAMEYWPNVHWNPYWYLGMPLFKYYQAGFYVMNWLTALLTTTSVARASILLIIFSHLLATLMTFLLCYKVSRRIWPSALASFFVLSNTFISLRSYGWEPITVVFLWLFPLGLLLFLRQPLKPFRLSLLLVLTLTYFSHPLLFFALCMFMGLYLFSIAVRHRKDELAAHGHYLWKYFALVLVSILIGAAQFFPQVSYHQATSGAHMGVSYLPFYQVAPNIISLKDFLFDAGNLKGPGPVIIISLLLVIIFALIEWRTRRQARKSDKVEKRALLHNHELISGLVFVLLMMILFYYLELWNIFPMNLLRSIQYHRIIPEFIIVAATLIAALSNIAYTYRHKAIYYAMLIGFVLASFIVVGYVQDFWATTDDIHTQEEFVWDQFEGRFSVPYTDQSFAVRNSFTERPQVYGYYEQGITNTYADELMSVSSGFHNAELTILYLKAGNVARLYVNTEEGMRDRVVMTRLGTSLPFVNLTGRRYSYFEVPLFDARLAQPVSLANAREVLNLSMGCRELYQEVYCGSRGEEFVTKDPDEVEYMRAYVDMVETPNDASLELDMLNPEQYRISVRGASQDTAVVVKMTHDKDFEALIDGQVVPIETIGPDFMLIAPGRTGDYTIELEYHVSMPIKAGVVVSIVSLLLVLIGFMFKKRITAFGSNRLRFPKGDMK